MLLRFCLTTLSCSLLLIGCSFAYLPLLQTVKLSDTKTEQQYRSKSAEKSELAIQERAHQLKLKEWQDLKSSVQYQYNFKPKHVFYRDKYIVFVYHHIDANEGMATLSPDKFSKQLQMLKDNEFNIVTLEDTIAYMQNKKELPPNSVVITFDDGYESFYTKAYPELKKFNFPATNFIVPSWVDSDHPKLPMLKWEEIKEMKKNGYSFYSHTFDSHKLKQDDQGKQSPMLTHAIFLDSQKRFENEEEYKTRIKEDLAMANNKIEDELGDNQPIICFPYGAYNKTVLDVARSLNIKYFYTTSEGINTKNSVEILRINAGVPWMTPERLMKRLKSVK